MDLLEMMHDRYVAHARGQRHWRARAWLLGFCLALDVATGLRWTTAACGRAMIRLSVARLRRAG